MPGQPCCDLIEQLFAEHDMIQPALFCLEEAAALLSEGRELPKGFQPWIVDFLTNFADRCHHVKEEEVLFPALNKKAAEEFVQVTESLVSDHYELRKSVSALALLDFNGPDARRALVEEALGYVGRLREHIHQENNDVFRTAQKLFSIHDLKPLDERGRRAGERSGTAGFMELYAPSLKEWEARIDWIRLQGK